MDHPSRIKDLCSVTVDDIRGGELATAHLLEQGHERIGFVHGPLSIRQCAERRRGVLRAVRAAGLDPDQVIVDITTSAQRAREGEESVEKLLRARIKPTAVFCANDLLALGLMRGLMKQGISIPGDFALVGYDDVEFASMLSTPLTTIRQPKYELGRTAAELLLDEASNPTSHQHKHIVYQPEAAETAAFWGGVQKLFAASLRRGGGSRVLTALTSAGTAAIQLVASGRELPRNQHGPRLRVISPL